MSAQDLGKITVTTNGDYNAATTYEKLCLVRYEGATYVSKQTTTGNTPSAASQYWQLISSDGTDFDPTMLAPDYSDLTFPVAEGNLCTYENGLYQANQDISTSEVWTAAHWDQVDVAELLANAPSGGSFLVRISSPEHASQTVTLTCGVYIYTGTFDSSGNAEIVVTQPGTYTITSGSDTIATKDVGVYVVSPSDRTIVYGFHLDETKSDPAQMISYNVQHNGADVENKNYTAAAVNLTTGVMNPGNWNLTDDFFVPKSCMLKYNGKVDYYLDENDETKKADGTASDVANTSYGGNAMMEWGRDNQKIYIKIVPDSTPTNGMTVYISNKQADSEFHAWAFYDCDGNEIEHFYTPKYFGSLISGKLRSLSGQTPYTNGTGQNEVDYAAANNVNGKTEWDTETWCDRTTVNLLLMMIGKTTNSQAAFGQGYTTGGSAASSLAASGTLNGEGQWYGSSTNNDKTKGVKVFGMEHWWGNAWRRVRGLLNMSGTVKYKLTYSQVDGTTQNGYDATGSGYKTVTNGTPGGTNGGYANVAVVNADGIFTKTASGSETTYFCDGLWFSNSQANYAFVGGNCADGAHCGALCVSLSAAFSNAAWHFGAALSCKPLAA